VNFPIGIPVHADMLADLVVTREVLIDERLAHNNVVIVSESLVFCEDAPAQQWNLHHAEVLRVGGENDGFVLKAVAGCGPLQDAEYPAKLDARPLWNGNQSRAAH